MIGELIGTPRRQTTRISVIFRSDGLELVFVFCGYASSSTPDQSPPSPSAPAALPRNERRPNAFFINSLFPQERNLLEYSHSPLPGSGRSRSILLPIAPPRTTPAHSGAAAREQTTSSGWP